MTDESAILDTSQANPDNPAYLHAYACWLADNELEKQYPFVFSGQLAAL